MGDTPETEKSTTPAAAPKAPEKAPSCKVTTLLKGKIESAVVKAVELDARMRGAATAEILSVGKTEVVYQAPVIGVRKVSYE